MPFAEISQASWWLMGLALTLMLLDYITGLLKALRTKQLNSSKMRDGLWHKLGFVIALVLPGVLDFAGAHVSLPFAGALLPAAAAYIVITEVTSILENLKEISPELGASKFLAIFNGKDDDHA